MTRRSVLDRKKEQRRKGRSPALAMKRKKPPVKKKNKKSPPPKAAAAKPPKPPNPPKQFPNLPPAWKLEYIVARDKVSQEKNIPLPEYFKHIFVITISDFRLNRLYDQIGEWKSRVTPWRGTVGFHIDLEKWLAKKKIRRDCNICVGELGCYSSHVRLWNHMLKKNIDEALILEDDVDMVYCERQSRALANCVQHLRNPDWDVFHLYFFSKDAIPQDYAPPKRCESFCGYMIRRKGIEKILQKLWPAHFPVDLYIHNLSVRGDLKSYRLKRRIAWALSQLDEIERYTVKTRKVRHILDERNGIIGN
jgi:GR25 family glycosyltransferase involved in LPS biosynthesis